jgi:peroxiredoxin
MHALRLLPLLVLAAGVATAAFAPDPDSWDPAPEFTLTDTNGRTHRLSDYRGRTVVLEWLNYECPFVRKHYGGNNMQSLQERYTERGVVWLAVVSSAPGEQGHYANATMNRMAADRGAHQTAILMDPTGVVGRAYGARTTPHMFVIDRRGEIVYNGAIDDRPTPSPASLRGARNYVSEALDAVLAGRRVPTPRTQPYGCSVKYA